MLFEQLILEYRRLIAECLVDKIELVFYSLAALSGKVDKFVCLLICHVAVRIEQLDHSGESLTDGKMVTLRE